MVVARSQAPRDCCTEFRPPRASVAARSGAFRLRAHRQPSSPVDAGSDRGRRRRDSVDVKWERRRQSPREMTGLATRHGMKPAAATVVAAAGFSAASPPTSGADQSQPRRVAVVPVATQPETPKRQPISVRECSIVISTLDRITVVNTVAHAIVFSNTEPSLRICPPGYQLSVGCRCHEADEFFQQMACEIDIGWLRSASGIYRSKHRSSRHSANQSSRTYRRDDGCADGPVPRGSARISRHRRIPAFFRCQVRHDIGRATTIHSPLASSFGDGLFTAFR